MKRALLVALASIAIGAPARAEIFECVDAAGKVTYVNDPSKCPNAEPHPLKGRVDHAPSSETRAPSRGADPNRSPSPEQRLEWALLEASDVRPGWEIVNEAPEDPRQDADLVEWGVTAKRSRHYTRNLAGRSQVCSIELWAFENVARARLAEQNFEFPDWTIEREGDTLVMVRAVTLAGALTDRTIFPDCEKLGNIVRTRAAKFSEE